MRRNLVLLTAVVLAAVLLSGCVIWPFGIAVKYDLEKDVFVTQKNERISKDTLNFERKLKFKETDEEYNAASFELKVTDKDNKAVEKPKLEDIVEDDKVTGVKVTIPAVGKKDITISIKFVADDK